MKVDVNQIERWFSILSLYSYFAFSSFYKSQHKSADSSFGLSTGKPFIDYINETFMRKEGAGNRYKIFVTSDREFVKEEARRAFGADRVISFNSTSFHTERGQFEFMKRSFVNCGPFGPNLNS